MDCDKKQTQGNQTVSKHTGRKPENGKAAATKQADDKGNYDQLAGNYTQVMSVAKLALKNKRSATELHRRRATISKKIEETRNLLAELRSRLEVIPEFDEDDLAEYREILEARVRDLSETSTLSEVEEDEDQEDEDIVYEDCESESEEYDEDEGASLGLKAFTESMHEDRSSSSDGMKLNEETYSNFDASSDEESDSGHGVKLDKGKGVETNGFLNEECF
ncbi:hypothetical protein N0V84_006177 [Fusarium piperis]|uniref:Uncharacterized protein n=1 Tax=Fusarium piperis TaxID=1435070 RepID=A0A9W8WCC8_9HYPO|nr:hypothetical protein N0V84_006177 [Fusarium piperis]